MADHNVPTVTDSKGKRYSLYKSNNPAKGVVAVTDAGIKSTKNRVAGYLLKNADNEKLSISKKKKLGLLPKKPASRGIL